MNTYSSLHQLSAGKMVFGILFFLLPFVAVAQTIGYASQSFGQQPLAAIAVPGDPDLGHVLAHEFAYCESPVCAGMAPSQCERQPSLCVPKSWSKAEIQTDFSDFHHRAFFLDSKTVTGGMDSDPRDGIEQAELVFFAGHGQPGSFLAWMNEDVPIADISPGDQRTRYLWMMSCNVMAHGPLLKTPDKQDDDFLAPQKFDSKSTANIFAQWGIDSGEAGQRKPLNPNLRMACGGSTELGGGSPFPTASIWSYKLMSRLPVADSFLLGLSQGYHVPLCISRGGSRPEETPLYDQDFLLGKNPAPDGDHLYIQYPVHLHPSLKGVKRKKDQELDFLGSSSFESEQSSPPRKLPVLIVSPTPLPNWLGQLPWRSLSTLNYGFKGGSPPLAGKRSLDSIFHPLPVWLSDALHPDDLCLRVHPNSGAVNLAWTPTGDWAQSRSLRAHLLSANSLLALLASLGLRREQWTGGHSVLSGVRFFWPKVEYIQMNIDGAKTSDALSGKFSKKDIQRTAKCFYIRMSSRLRIQGVRNPVPVFGEGAEWLLAGCPSAPSEAKEIDASVNVCQRPSPFQFNLSWVGREVKGKGPESESTVLPLADARAEAIRKLGSLKYKYQVVSFRWGYKAAPVHCKQERMYVVYRFYFRPNVKGDLPITIEVPAHKLPNGKQIEDTWTCDPETL